MEQMHDQKLIYFNIDLTFIANSEWAKRAELTRYFVWKAKIQ
jgi:hypothetical protein